MDSLQQYLDLYSVHKQLIESKSAKVFNRIRQRAYERLKDTGLPVKGSENYEITDLGTMLAPDYGLNIARIPLDVDPMSGFKCGIPLLSSSIFFFLNDRWAESRASRTNLTEGVEIGPLSALSHEDSTIASMYGTLADLANPIVSLNSMLVQEGMYLKIKRGVKVERPIQLVNIIENTVPLMALRRLLIIVEEGAEVKLLSCSHSFPNSLTKATVSVAEIFAAKGSRLDFYDMEEDDASCNRLSAIYLSQQEESDVLIENFTLHNGRTRNEYHCCFEGSNASLRLYGLGIEGAESVLDNYSHISHKAVDCHTEELFKYILDDEARGAFTGLVYVAQGASGTEAYQNNRNLVGSDKARMFSKPQLEIYNDDVKCSHGSATGQLDDLQLFYLRSRGLDEDTARLLLKQAFMADVIDGVRLPLLKDRLHGLIEKRIMGQNASCGDCDVCTKDF